jgi:hypothetical protein
MSQYNWQIVANAIIQPTHNPWSDSVAFVKHKSNYYHMYEKYGFILDTMLPWRVQLFYICAKSAVESKYSLISEINFYNPSDYEKLTLAFYLSVPC